jgi:uncharacterized protein YkwD
MIKKIVSLCLSFALVFSLYVVETQAKNTTSSESCSFTQDSLQAFSLKEVKTIERNCKKKIDRSSFLEIAQVLKSKYQELSKKFLVKIYTQRVDILQAKIFLRTKVTEKVKSYNFCNTLSSKNKRACQKSLRSCFKKEKSNFSSCYDSLQDSFSENSSVQVQDTKTPTSSEKVRRVNTQKPELLTCSGLERIVNGECVKVSESNKCSWPQVKSFIPKDGYQDLSLKNKIPQVLRKGEIIAIQGDLLDTSYSKVSGFISNDNNFDKAVTVSTNNNKFLIPFLLLSEGDHSLIALKGTKGRNRSYAISIENPLCEKAFSQMAAPATNLSWYIKNNTPVFSWDTDSELSKIIFTQNDKKVEYIISNSQNQWALESKDFLAFKDFKEGEVKWSVQTATSNTGYAFGQNRAWSKPVFLDVNVINHQFSSMPADKISITQFPQSIQKDQSILIKGQILADAKKAALIIRPNGQVDEVSLISSDKTQRVDSLSSALYFPKSSHFSLSYTPNTNGTYIIEINGTDGAAILNTPVYEQNTIPLLPGFFDIHVRQQGNLSSLSQKQAIEKMLSLINIDRNNHGAASVKIDNSLNSLAQLRANDMQNNNYISHFDRNGKSANDVRSQYGINSFISENIAQDIFVDFAEEGLMRSAGHRKNIINPRWKRVGIARANGQNGTFIYVQHFSENEVTSINMHFLKAELIEKLNNIRNTDIQVNNILEVTAQGWSDSMAKNSFFSFTDHNGVEFLDQIRLSGINSSSFINILANTNASGLVDGFLDIKELHDSRNTNIGIGLAQGSDGLIKLTLIYTR